MWRVALLRHPSTAHHALMPRTERSGRSRNTSCPVPAVRVRCSAGPGLPDDVRRKIIPARIDLLASASGLVSLGTAGPALAQLECQDTSASLESRALVLGTFFVLGALYGVLLKEKGSLEKQLAAGTDLAAVGGSDAQALAEKSLRTEQVRALAREAELKSQLAAAAKKADTLTSEKARGDEVLAAAKSEASTAATKLAAQAAELRELQAKLEAAQREGSEAARAVKDLQDKLAAARKEADAASTLKSANADLQKKLDAAGKAQESEASSAKQRAADLQKELDATLKKMAADDAASQKSIRELKEKLESASLKAASDAKAMKELQEKMDVTNKAAAEAAKKIESLRAAEDTAAKAAAEQAALASAMAKADAETRELKDTYDSQIAALKTELDAQKLKAKDARSRYKALDTKMKALLSEELEKLKTVTEQVDPGALLRANAADRGRTPGDENVWEEKVGADGARFFFNSALSRIVATAEELPAGAKIVNRG